MYEFIAIFAYLVVVLIADIKYMGSNKAELERIRTELQEMRRKLEEK